MFKALEQASVYGQTNVINTDSLRFTCMAVSTERSDAVGCTKSAIQLIFGEYSIQIFDFHMRKLDLNQGLIGSIIRDIQTPFPQKSLLGRIVCGSRPDTLCTYLATLTNGERGGGSRK